MLDELEVSPHVRLALRSVRREYPYHLVHLVRSDTDLAAPRQLTPAFCGCFDWHSAVHGHWVLARIVRLMPGSTLAGPARSALGESLTRTKLEAERRYLEPRPGFERPYGLAWLLTLHGELLACDELEAGRWAGRLEPLAELASDRLVDWLSKLPHPIRSGVHSQTAFAMGLALDWARQTGAARTRTFLEERAHGFYGEDRDYPLHLEPSGEDFLSPSLGAADLMRRVLDPGPFADWIGRTMPRLPTDGAAGFLSPVQSPDRTDGRLAHLDGLSLSRAWMLRGIAEALGSRDPRAFALRRCSRVHRDAALSRNLGAHYAGAHWLGTFAVYLLTHAASAGPCRDRRREGTEATS